MSKSNKKVYIINMSACLTLYPEYNVIFAYAKLFETYNGKTGWGTSLASCASSLFCCCGKSIEDGIRMGPTAIWLLYKRSTKEYSKLIDNYKLGKISTKYFFSKLLDLFPFLKNTKFDEDTIDYIWDKKPELSLLDEVNKKEEMKQELIPLLLLQIGWNDLIGFTTSDMEKIKYLESKENCEIYYISYTNESHAYLIKQKYREYSPKSLFVLDDDNNYDSQSVYQNNNNNNLIVDSFSIKGNAIFSYRNSLPKKGTPGLIDELTKQLKNNNIDKKDIFLITQFKADKEFTKNILPVENIKDANALFSAELNNNKDHNMQVSYENKY